MVALVPDDRILRLEKCIAAMSKDVGTIAEGTLHFYEVHTANDRLILAKMYSIAECVAAIGVILEDIRQRLDADETSD